MKILPDLFLTFARVGGLTFGGGLSMLPMLKKEIVDKKQWANESELLDYYAIGQCTPGIIAVNTATFIGYKKAKVAGGIFATLGMVTPSIIIILLIASILTGFMEQPVVIWALNGIRAAVCALMISTAITMLKKSVVDLFCAAIFAAAFILATFLGVSSVLVVIAAALLGVLIKRIRRQKA